MRPHTVATIMPVVFNLDVQEMVGWRFLARTPNRRGFLLLLFDRFPVVLNFVEKDDRWFLNGFYRAIIDA